MRRSWFWFIPMGLLALVTLGNSGPSPGQAGHAPGKKFPELEEVVRGAKELDGLFRLYLKDETVFAELQHNQFEVPYLCPISIARGLSSNYFGGDTLNDDQWVLLFRRVGDRVFLIRRNVRFQAKSSTTVARAVETTYTDSVLMALRIYGTHSGRNSVLLSFNDIFMTNFADLRLGHFDANRSTWGKVKAFPDNIEMQVSATYTGGGGDGVIDDRASTLVLHYGLCKLPDSGYTPRLADDRVGHVLSVVKDFSNDTKPTPFLRYVNRWRLERADGSTWKEGAKLVPPKKKIVFWIEKSVPDEYRGYVRDGILEWNKAFAKIGYRDAIEVRQQENEDFDPEDIHYNTFRWVTNDMGFAKGPSRANPFTGELIDADIVFDASMVRYYRQAGALWGGNSAIGDAISPIRAMEEGIGLPGSTAMGWNDRLSLTPDRAARERASALQHGWCECGTCLKRELNLLAMTLAVRDAAPPADSAVLSEELIGQAIKETTMHEVGHTLGLRHNFKASTMLKNEDLNNTAITRAKGLSGSVMDYNPVNIAPKGVKQGDFFSTTLGPYDYWAIEYAYRPLSGGTEGEYSELKKIAQRGAEAGHDYATDEDLMTSSDPLVNLWDLGADPMKFAEDRMLLAEELLVKLAEKGADKGEGYQRTREAFGILLQQYGNSAYLISKYIGGVSMHRDHAGDPSGRDPQVVVAPDKQRAALKFLQAHLLTDKPFQFSPKLLRRLASDRWAHWGNERVFMNRVEFPVHERILDIQKVVLSHTLSNPVLSRIQNNALGAEADAKEKPLTLAEVFRTLTDGIWNDAVNGGKGVKPTLATSIVRRNLQREYLKSLGGLVNGTPPADARSLARAHLKEIQHRIETQLANKNLSIEETTRAHLEESRERIAKVLSASLMAREP
jgi:Met-zincin/Domain of unknown function (DUF5117)